MSDANLEKQLKNVEFRVVHWPGKSGKLESRSPKHLLYRLSCDLKFVEKWQMNESGGPIYFI